MKSFAKFAALIALLTVTADADARGRRGRFAGNATAERTYSAVDQVAPADAGVGKAVDALDELNAIRARSGLRPYVRCPLLTIAAKNVATHRAARGIAGHVNDFAFLPEGATARAAGCAAWHGNDWGACCTYENWTYAGAAYCRGYDGKRYMHLFVR